MRRILLVGGDVGLQVALAVTLKAYFLVDTASTASEGLYRLAQSPPELVILEIPLADLDAPSFLRALRASHPTCPVFVITSVDRLHVLRKLTRFAIGGFLPKPLRVDKLLERINVLLGGSPLLSGPRFSRHVSRTIEYLSQRYTRSLTLKAVAEAIGISPGHLAHMFRTETGLTVKQFVAEIRVEVSKRLLLDTDEKLDSIAETVGFCDASHLSRVFRKYVGHWPGEYRQHAMGA